MKDLYTSTYVNAQLKKFRNRNSNHWQNHISLAKKLVADYAPPPPVTLLDLGCSIGTFALEFALDGYDTIGLDFDSKALEQGEELAKELGCKPKWVCEDAGSFVLQEKVDIVVCFDLLEHLSDDIIIRTLSCVRENLKNGGAFIFHTFPTQYDHVFYRGALTCLPLIPFRSLTHKSFLRLVKYYSSFLDMFYYLRYGKTHKGVIAGSVHPNPLSRGRLKDFLENTGFDVVLLEMGLDSVNPLKPGQGVLAKKFFSDQPAACRSLWGAAYVK